MSSLQKSSEVLPDSREEDYREILVKGVTWILRIMVFIQKDEQIAMICPTLMLE
jgi:hypothetical protein